jgi:hypothetical protein
MQSLIRSVTSCMNHVETSLRPCVPIGWDVHFVAILDVVLKLNLLHC